MTIEIMRGLPDGYADDIVNADEDPNTDREAEAYARGYEDGYDQGCMDMVDDDDLTGKEPDSDCPWK